jgi:hypothetical protein
LSFSGKKGLGFPTRNVGPQDQLPVRYSQFHGLRTDEKPLLEQDSLSLKP